MIEKSGKRMAEVLLAAVRIKLWPRLAKKKNQK